MAKYIKNPFGVNGDLVNVPDDTQVDGSISYNQGYPDPYQRDPATDPTAKRIERAKMNKLFNDVTSNIKEWQEQTYPDWIPDDGSGTPFAYNEFAIVRYTDGNNYVSLVDSNDEEPTTGSSWQEFSLWVQSFAPTAPSITGTATFTNSTNNISLTGLGDLEGLEVGDVIQISGAVNSKNNSEFTVEDITDSSNVIVNEAHAGGTTSKSLTDETSTSGVTIKLLCKWYNATAGLGQGWVDVTSNRTSGVNYPTQENRSMEVSLITNTAVSTLYVENEIVGRLNHGSSADDTLSAIVPTNQEYSFTNISNIDFVKELR